MPLTAGQEDGLQPAADRARARACHGHRVPQGLRAGLRHLRKGALTQHSGRSDVVCMEVQHVCICHGEQPPGAVAALTRSSPPAARCADSAWCSHAAAHTQNQRVRSMVALMDAWSMKMCALALRLNHQWLWLHSQALCHLRNGALTQHGALMQRHIRGMSRVDQWWPPWSTNTCALARMGLNHRWLRPHSQALCHLRQGVLTQHDSATLNPKP